MYLVIENNDWWLISRQLWLWLISWLIDELDRNFSRKSFSALLIYWLCLLIDYFADWSIMYITSIMSYIECTLVVSFSRANLPIGFHFSVWLVLFTFAWASSCLNTHTHAYTHPHTREEMARWGNFVFLGNFSFCFWYFSSPSFFFIGLVARGASSTSRRSSHGSHNFRNSHSCRTRSKFFRLYAVAVARIWNTFGSFSSLFIFALNHFCFVFFFLYFFWGSRTGCMCVCVCAYL